nr:DUF3099 domain-containing protein [Saccharopolyspora gloriosae]
MITEAQPSYDDQQAERRRKYAIMMSLRIPCLIAGAACYQIWWLALIIVAISIPLPWMAVLIANDRPPRKTEQVNRYQHSDRALESGAHRVIEDS